MDKLMEKCKAAVAAFPEIELAYWFGSRAKGKGTPISDWDQAPLPLRYAVVQEGVLLISRNESLRVDVETQTRSRYWDFEPCLREYQEAFFRRVAERGL